MQMQQLWWEGMCRHIAMQRRALGECENIGNFQWHSTVLHAVFLLHLLINNFYLQFMSWISSDQKIRSRMSNKQNMHCFNQDLLCSRLCCKQQTASQQWREASFTEKPVRGKKFTRLEAEVMSKNHLIQTHNPFILYSIIMALVEIKKPMFID
jgi:hypothetical protein